jgi:hypothetical protein
MASSRRTSVTGSPSPHSTGIDPMAIWKNRIYSPTLGLFFEYFILTDNDDILTKINRVTHCQDNWEIVHGEDLPENYERVLKNPDRLFCAIQGVIFEKRVLLQNAFFINGGKLVAEVNEWPRKCQLCHVDIQPHSNIIRSETVAGCYHFCPECSRTLIETHLTEGWRSLTTLCDFSEYLISLNKP